MKFIFTLMVTAMLLPILTFAQSNYKPGYVVTTKGDTLKGLINIKEWNFNPRKISFKTAADSKVSRELGVNDITFFAATNLEAYQRYAGSLNADPTDIYDLPAGRNTNIIADTVFLKIIQKGDKITMFEYTDNRKEHFFVTETKDNQPTELIYRIYTTDGKTVKENGYMEQLYLLAQKFNDNKNLKTQIEQADYRYTKLVEISRLINKNTAKDDEVTVGKSKSTFFFASAGFNVSKFTSDYAFTGADPSAKTAGTNSKNSTPASYFPRLSIGVNILSNPTTGKLVFRVEAAYTANKGSSATDGSENYSLSQNTFSLIPQILYHFYNTENLKFYGAAGVSLNGSNYNSKTGNAYGLLSKWTSFPLHVGAVINKKFDVSVAYIPEATITNTVAYDIQVKAVQIALNYYFN